jgi:hypothetical protein
MHRLYAAARNRGKGSLRRVRRRLGVSPMQRVLRELRRRSIRFEQLRALELFGHTGELHTLDYANAVKSLDIWEIDPACETPLRRNFPAATITITDSYAQIQDTAARYDLVVADNPMGAWGGHVEHFDLLPHVFRILSEDAVVVLTVIPQIGPRQTKRAPYLVDPAYLSARREFYRTSDPLEVPSSVMHTAYAELCVRFGYELADAVFVRRNRLVSYAALHVVRNGVPSP